MNRFTRVVLRRGRFDKEEGVARRNNSNSKLNQNQSGAIEPIATVVNRNQRMNKTKRITRTKTSYIYA